MDAPHTFAEVTFDTRVFSVTAIKQAAYAHLRSFSTDMTVHDHEICCKLIFIDPSDGTTRARVVEEFRKDVLDHDLRERLSAETAPIRNVILAHAFSKTGLSAHESVSSD